MINPLSSMEQNELPRLLVPTQAKQLKRVLEFIYLASPGCLPPVRYQGFGETIPYLTSSDIPQANSIARAINPTRTITAYIEHVLVFVESS